MMYLLDTCVLSELIRKMPDPNVEAWFKAQDANTLFISSLTIAELSKGIEKLAPSERRNYLEKWLSTQILPNFTGRIIAVDETIALKWGRLYARSEMLGKPLPVIDSLIASTAISSNMALVTRNTKDMQFPEIKLLNPWS